MKKPVVLFMGPRQAIEVALQDKFEILKFSNDAAGEALLQSRGRDVTYAMTHTGLRPMDKAVLDLLPELKMIANVGVGYESIDIDECIRRKIRVSNGAGSNAIDVAEFVIGLMFDVTRHISLGDRLTRAGEWTGQKFVMGQRLYGRTLGILGMGNIGLEIAKRGEALGMTVEYHSRTPKKDLPYVYHENPDSLAKVSEYFVIVTPGGDGTYHLVDRKVLAALGTKGYVINVARGTVVDEKALIEALEKKTIRGAALDVFENEPTIPPALFKLDNVTLQPHQGGLTTEGIAATAQLAVENILAHLAGKPMPTPVA